MRRLALAVPVMFVALAACVSDEGAVSDEAPCPEGAFCDGFEGPAYAAKWTENGKLAGVSISIDGTTRSTGSQSVRFDVGAEAPEGRQHLAHGLDENATKITLSFATRMTSNTNLTFLTVELGPASDQYYDTVFLAADEKGTVLKETVNDASGFKVDALPIPNMPSDRFGKFTLTVDLAAKSVTFKDDGSNIETKKTLTLPHGKPRELRLGVAYTVANARKDKASMWFDDIVLR